MVGFVAMQRPTWCNICVCIEEVATFAWQCLHGNRVVRLILGWATLREGHVEPRGEKEVQRTLDWFSLSHNFQLLLHLSSMKADVYKAWTVGRGTGRAWRAAAAITAASTDPSHRHRWQLSSWMDCPKWHLPAHFKNSRSPHLERWRREIHPSQQGNSLVLGVQGEAWPLQCLIWVENNRWRGDGSVSVFTELSVPCSPAQTPLPPSVPEFVA